LAKYSDQIRSVRKITRETLTALLEEKPRNIMQIWKIIRKNNEEICDDEIKCTCGRKDGNQPEWQHQVRWGVQDLKYHKKIDLNRETRKYFIKKEE
jgi:hypothetical protein